MFVSCLHCRYYLFQVEFHMSFIFTVLENTVLENTVLEKSTCVTEKPSFKFRNSKIRQSYLLTIWKRNVGFVEILLIVSNLLPFAMILGSMGEICVCWFAPSSRMPDPHLFCIKHILEIFIHP